MPRHNNFAVISSFSEAESVWRSLADPATLYDEWSFRRCFFNSTTHDLWFLVDDTNTPGLVIPLQCARADQQLSFVGAPFMERNRSFCKPGFEQALINAYRSLPDGTQLDDICLGDPVSSTADCSTSDPAYILQKQSIGYTGRDDLVRFVPKNIRENIRKVQKSIDSGRRTVCLTEPGPTLEGIKQLSFDRFGEDSWLELPHIYQGFLQLPELAAELNTSVECVSITEQDDFIAGCISLRYNNDLYMLMATARHSPAYSGLGSYLYYYCMATAFEQGCQRIDTGIGDCGWKDRWGLEKVPQFLFSRPRLTT